ncbi:iron chelate uptake ABC transporter family permease subunit [Sphingobacterium wenxiniae]|uniref:Iron complex transport system permease protein n=1 Tax=Sphingobacterium wenxiniae TaxID=683125 RepID=A0A1I6NRB6_9SPHI|nr:iron chelate uptake ABC transporter family permease subunit [Sphingobacterium wenxiniae]SFS30424.1 iron complex transport system permease protein [Sphingobacterium wenxiniae]
MKQRQKIIITLIILVIAVILFITYNMGNNIDYVLSRRGIRLATMIIVGISVAFSSVIFQTITNNRILTPSIMGYESIFILFQTLIVYVYGDKAFNVISQQENFFYAVLLMLFFSVFMYLLIFGRQRKNIFYLLLLGMVMGTLFNTLSQFMHVVIDPNEFSIVQNFMFVSFAKMNVKLLGIASGTLLVALVIAIRYIKYLDVIALGKDHAINLGLDYNKLIRLYMLIIALLVSVSTALVGPITFLGILVTNLTYELFKAKKHIHIVWLCSAVSCICLIVGQFFIEHVLSFSTTVSIVINFIGGVYFMYLIWRTRKKIS